MKPAVIRRTTTLGLGAMSLMSGASAASSLSRPDTFLARVEALASMETLSADILASRSATKALETWCGSHAMADMPKIRAERVPSDLIAATDAQRRRLGVGVDEPIRYRRVRLVCGAGVLSEADNWYVPSRLTPDMNHLLDTTDTPFGRVVATMNPTRETFAVTRLWQVLPPNWEMSPPSVDHPDAVLDIPHILFEHHAILFDAQHRPVSEVAEHYTRDILAFGSTRTNVVRP